MVQDFLDELRKPEIAPPFPRVGFIIRVRVNPNPREGWVSSLPETGIDPASIPVSGKLVTHPSLGLGLL